MAYGEIWNMVSSKTASCRLLSIVKARIERKHNKIPYQIMRNKLLEGKIEKLPQGACPWTPPPPSCAAIGRSPSENGFDKRCYIF